MIDANERGVVVDDGSAGTTPVARPAAYADGNAGITPVARAGGRLFGDGVVVSPVRTAGIVTVERPFALEDIRFERKLGRRSEIP